MPAHIKDICAGLAVGLFLAGAYCAMWAIVYIHSH